MKSKLENDFLIIAAITILLAIIIVSLDSNVMRIILGLPFLLFFPGYTLVAALFPRKSDLDGIERVALSFGLSIAVVPLVGLILNYAWEIKLYPILISLAVFILAMSAVAWYRRRRFPQSERFNVSFSFRLPSWERQSNVDKLLSVVLVIAILGAIGTLAYVIATPKVGEKFTEFYILGLGEKAEWYPTEFVMEGGKTILVRYGSEEAFQEEEEEYGRVTLGIVNREHREAIYQVEVRINGEEVKVQLDGQEVEGLGPILLEHEKTWEQEIGFAATDIGEDQKVEFVLYMDGEPYFEEGESLHLWIDVKEDS